MATTARTPGSASSSPSCARQASPCSPWSATASWPSGSTCALPDRSDDRSRTNLGDAKERSSMKIVVIGGTGLIGTKVVAYASARGHAALAASPRTGVNTLTGEGLAEVLAGAAVVVDVSNAPSFEDEAVLAFFRTSTGNLLAAEATAGVGHHVALSVVGADRLPASGYLRAKVAQERLIEASSIPYSIVRATQFFEFLAGIADAATEGDTVRVAPVAFQPMAADDVAEAVGRTALGAPL